MKLKSVSCTSNLLARTCDSKKCIRFRPMLISNPHSHRQNQNLETILIDIVVLCLPHDTIACIHMCDECKRSNAPNVCYKLLSISLQHEQIFITDQKYRVCQYEPNINISEQFVSKLWTILQLIQFLLL